MKSTGPLTSVPPFPRFPRRIAGSGIFFIIIAALFALGVVCSAAPGLAQGPPEWAQDENSSGLSPSVDESDGGTPVTVTGVLTILHADDFLNKRSEFFYHLEDRETKQTYRLHFGKNPPGHLRTGATVTVHGKAKGQDLILALDESGGASIQTVAAAAEAVAGEQRTIVIVANFLDATVSCSTLAVQDLMFSDPDDQSIDDLFQETSLGAVWFTGNVAGPYTIAYSSTGACDVNAWAVAAEAAARAAGVDTSAYDRKVYVLPSANTCGWSGLASLGGSPSYAWIFRCDLEGVYGHEVGHNLGMNHAATLSSEYGDTSDVMGSEMSGLRQVNAPHKEQMGWLPPEQFITVTQGGVYNLAPLELDPAQALSSQVLKIAKPDTGEHYYISYRQPLGFDANLSAELLRRVHVHRYQGNGNRTWLLRGLLDGESFVDGVNGVTITHFSHTPDYATVEVRFNGAGPTCTPAAPTVSLSPASQGGAAGTTVAYTVSVSNTDSTNCAASTFSLGRTIPSGWAGTLSPTTLTLSAGQTGQATLSVTSAAGAAPASYGLNVAVSDATQAVHTGSATASYVVVATCSPQAPTVSVSPASQGGGAGTTLAYAVSVRNADSAACAASTFSLGRIVPSGWTGTLSPTTLTLSAGQTGQATLSVTSATGAAPASYGLNAVATDVADPARNRSANASYVVQAPAPGDTQPPTPPTGLSAGLKGKNVKLSWGAATDNVGVSGYSVWRDGTRIGQVAGTSYADNATTSGATYTYWVKAFDGAGNTSASSNQVAFTVNNAGGRPRK